MALIKSKTDDEILVARVEALISSAIVSNRRALNDITRLIDEKGTRADFDTAMGAKSADVGVAIDAIIAACDAACEEKIKKDDKIKI